MPDAETSSDPSTTASNAEMQWYCAHVLLNVERAVRRQHIFRVYEYRYLILAATPDEAQQQAEDRARMHSEHTGVFTWAGKEARLTYLGLRKLIECIADTPGGRWTGRTPLAKDIEAGCSIFYVKGRKRLALLADGESVEVCYYDQPHDSPEQKMAANGLGNTHPPAGKSGSNPQQPENSAMSEELQWFCVHTLIYTELKKGRQQTYLVLEDLHLILALNAEEAERQAEARARFSAECNDTYTLGDRPARDVYLGIRKTVACTADAPGGRWTGRTAPAEDIEASYSFITVRGKKRLERLARGEPVEIWYNE